MEASMFKVVGVGGAGINAVEYMMNKNALDATFMVCDTDRKRLENSTVPQKLLLESEGLGMGGDIKKGMYATSGRQDYIETMLSDGTKVVIIIAGMGGGTGSGVAIITPVLAQRMGVFTVGIVTLPFKFEGKDRMNKALDAVATMKLVANEVYVIANDSLAKTYSELTVTNAFKAIDEALSEKTGKIINALTAHFKNISFNDIKNILKDI